MPVRKKTEMEKYVRKIINTKKNLLKMFVVGEDIKKIIAKQMGLLRGLRNTVYFKNKRSSLLKKNAHLSYIKYFLKFIAQEFPIDRPLFNSLTSIFKQNNIKSILSINAFSGFFERLL